MKSQFAEFPNEQKKSMKGKACEHYYMNKESAFFSLSLFIKS